MKAVSDPSDYAKLEEQLSKVRDQMLHLKGATKADRLFTAEGNIANYQAASVDTRNTHGTGCTLSSAITARLALGDSLIEAIRQAKEYLTEAIRQGADVTIGHGHGPVNHFYQPQSLQIQP